MSNFSAIIPVADMASANTELEEQGFGPNNFSIPAYTTGQPTHGLLHAWGDPVFQAAVEAIPNVIVEIDGEPLTLVTDACVAVGATWGQDALPLENTLVVPNTLYRYALDGTLWNSIQAYDSSVYSDPYAIPALIRRVRDPLVPAQWVQPIDQYDSYKLQNPFTGFPEECIKDDIVWATLVDNNVWVPGAVGSESLWAVVP